MSVKIGSKLLNQTSGLSSRTTGTLDVMVPNTRKGTLTRKPAMVNECQKTNLDLDSQRSQVSNPSKTELGTLNKNSRRSGLRFNPERTLTHVQIRMNKDSSQSATMLSEEADDHPTFEHTNARDMSAEEICDCIRTAISEDLKEALRIVYNFRSSLAKEKFILCKLEQSGDTDYNAVSEILLHASCLPRISNLEKFVKVRMLDLSANYIKCIENLEHNQELRELKLYDNEINQITGLEKLRDLQHLQLQHNKIRIIGRGLCGLAKLQILRLDFNRILSIESQELSPCGQLTSLDLSRNKLESIAAVSCLPNLEELSVRGNRLKSISNLSRCKRLQEVDFSDNPLTDMSGLKDVCSLKILNLSDCKSITNLRSIGRLKSLEELNVSGCRLSNLDHLVQQFRQLQVLNLSRNALDKLDCLDPLLNMQEMVELYVAGNPFVEELGSKPIFFAPVIHSSLSHLEVIDGINLSDAPMLPGTRPSTSCSSRPGTARPMTASSRPDSAMSRCSTSLVSTRPSSASVAKLTAAQVGEQLNAIQDQLSSFETEFAEKLKQIRSSFNVLPLDSPSALDTSRKSTSDIVAEQRSGSDNRSGSANRGSTLRSRLRDAKSFSEQQKLENKK